MSGQLLFSWEIWLGKFQVAYSNISELLTGQQIEYVKVTIHSFLEEGRIDVYRSRRNEWNPRNQREFRSCQRGPRAGASHGLSAVHPGERAPKRIDSAPAH